MGGTLPHFTPVNVRRLSASLPGMRILARYPGSTALSIVTLALGIAAATTTFSAAYAAVLRPIPFSDPARLVVLSHTRQNAQTGLVPFRWSFAGAKMVRRQAG